MCYSDRLGLSYQSSGVCRLVVGRIEELGCRVILTEHGGVFCALHSGRDEEDWVCSVACGETQEAEMMDLRQGVTWSPGGSSDRRKTQRQITLGPKRWVEKSIEGACLQLLQCWAHLLNMDSEVLCR